jgi:hypothetical protein
MRVDLEVPDRLGSYALDAALEGLVGIGVAELEDHSLSGHGFPALYTSGVRYAREEGTERWLPPSIVLGLGRGDCEDLAAWRAAELRVTGEDPEARARVIRSGPRTWHAVVERSSGELEDPSRELGMGVGMVGALTDWQVRCARTPDGWVCSLSRQGQGVMAGAPYGHDAIAQACELGYAVGEVGQIPGLDILARIARGAMDAALPPEAAPGKPGGALQASQELMVPTGTDAAVRADVDRLALQLKRVITTEANRKLREAQRVAVRGRR